MRVAALDVGTNTVLLLVAEPGRDGALVAVREQATITRLGEGVDRTRRLAASAVERTVACMEEYARVVNELGVDRVAVVGTSAMRDAAGGEDLRRRIRNLFGVEARVLSGEAEARLTFRGALGGLGKAVVGDVGVFDIGGGSTEVVVGKIEGEVPQVSFAQSFDVGSVRLTERYGEDRVALMNAASEVFAAVPPLPRGHPPVGIAGTMTTLAAVSLGLEPYNGAQVHGHAVQRSELERVLDRLANLDVVSRQRVRGMDPKRADVIVAGGCLALALLDHWSVDSVTVSDRGVRWGLAEELLQPGS